MKTFPIAVIVERQQIESRWADEKWEVVGVVPAFDAPVEDSVPRRILFGSVSTSRTKDWSIFS